MNRHKSSKIISNSAMLLIFGYVLLIIFSRGLLDTTYQGFNPVNLLYFLIAAAFVGIAFASYNFSKDNIYSWEKGKSIAIISISSVISLIIAVILFSIEEVINNGTTVTIIHIIASIIMILSYLGLTLKSIILTRQLKILNSEGYIIKEPTYYITGAFSLISISYLIFTIGHNIHTTLAGIINIIGIILSVIGVILLIIGYVNLSIAFKAYPYLVENEEFKSKKG